MSLLTLEQHKNRLVRLKEYLVVHIQCIREYQLDFTFISNEEANPLIDEVQYKDSVVACDEVFSYDEDVDKIIVTFQDISYVFSAFYFTPQEMMYEIATRLSSDEFRLDELEQVLMKLEREAKN